VVIQDNGILYSTKTAAFQVLLHVQTGTKYNHQSLVHGMNNSNTCSDPQKPTDTL